MAKIFLQGDKFIEVSVDTCVKAEQEYLDHKENIHCGDGVLIKRTRITGFDYKEKVAGNDRDYDLKNPEDKKIIKDFEADISFAKQKQLAHPIEYYGGKSDRDNYVWNDILGIVHAGIVQFAEEQGAITKPDVWRVCRGSNYEIFKKKMRALDDLMWLREYAEKKDLENLEQSIQGSVKKME